MDLRKLKKLIELVEESSIAELEITEGEEKVRISKPGSGAPNYAIMPQAMPAMMQASPQSMTVATPGNADASDGPASTAKAVLDGHVVKSPMVGTFYRAASPGGFARRCPASPAAAQTNTPVRRPRGSGPARE